MKGSLKLFLLISLLLINGCSKAVEKQTLTSDLRIKLNPKKAGEKMTVKMNDKIKVHYIGTLDNGTVFDKSQDGQPLEFVVGSGQIIPGFEQAVLGMKLNEEKKITIKAENAYGQRNETLVREFPKTSLPENFKPEKGMIITLNDQSGRTIPATITGVNNDNITLDLNHPLAGKDLVFNIKLVEIN